MVIPNWHTGKLSIGETTRGNHLIPPAQPAQRVLQGDEEFSAAAQLLQGKIRSISCPPTSMAQLWTSAPSLVLLCCSLDLSPCRFHLLTQHSTSLTKRAACCQVIRLNCWSNAAPSAKISRMGRWGGKEAWSLLAKCNAGGEKEGNQDHSCWFRGN